MPAPFPPPHPGGDRAWLGAPTICVCRTLLLACSLLWQHLATLSTRHARPYRTAAARPPRLNPSRGAQPCAPATWVMPNHVFIPLALPPPPAPSSTLGPLRLIPHPTCGGPDSAPARAASPAAPRGRTTPAQRRAFAAHRCPAPSLQYIPRGGHHHAREPGAARATRKRARAGPSLQAPPA
ncbi:MAG: hypothetical protein J3K34DRAFT_418686 [Monoraphidium minutum]|nr:MAG: hypothetical protein J3K34DRAFT_418686 [Monoraphidium minutum]